MGTVGMLVLLAVFKTDWEAFTTLVGSIPTRSRHTSPNSLVWDGRLKPWHPCHTVDMRASVRLDPTTASSNILLCMGSTLAAFYTDVTFPRGASKLPL